MIKQVFVVIAALAIAWGFVFDSGTVVAATTNLDIKQTATEWLILDTNIPWTKDIIALGPSKWQSTYEKNNAIFLTEIWSAPLVVNCHKTPTLCRPPGVNGGVRGNDSRFGQWLWGYGSESDPKLSTYEYKVLAPNNQLLNSSNNVGCGLGTGIAGQPGNCIDETHAVYTSGAYGWGYGGVELDMTQDGPEIVGFQMPLQWDVEGTYAPPPPPQGGE